MPTGIYKRIKKRGGWKLSEITKKAQKGNKNALGYKHTKKAKEKIRLGNKGKKASETTKKKMRLRMIGNKYNLGRKHSEETKKKQSEAHKREKSYWWKDGRCSNKNYLSWIKNKRNRLKRSINGFHTFGEWQTLKAQYNWTCPCCKKQEPQIKLTEDHIIPISKGGSDNIENIQPLCRSCNSKKHNKVIKYNNKKIDYE